jgi:hypothetical protein
LLKNHANTALLDAQSGERLRALWLSGCVIASCFAAGWAPVADGDIFWHMAAGREMWLRGAWLTHDDFSVSAAGRPWVDVHWLFQWLAYAVHSQLGLTGIVLAKCAVLSGSALVLCFSLPRHARAVYCVLLALTLLCARQLLLARPVIVSLLCLSVFWALLERHRRSGSARLLWLLLPVQIAWSNVQGLSALGPAVIAAYAVGASLQERRAEGPLFAALGGSMLASLVSPFGVEALRLPLRLFERLLPLPDSPYQSVAENAPPLAQSDVNAAEYWHLPWFLLGIALVFALRARRVPLSHLITLGGFVALALLGNRNVLLLYFMAAPLCALHLTPNLRRLRLPVRDWGPAMLFVPLLALLLMAAAREPAVAQPTPFHFPIGSAQAIAAHGGKGEVFSADHHGGYLIWKLYPAFRPYVDTRWILRSPDEFREYLELADRPERFTAFAAKHAFAYVVLPVSYPDRYLGLIAHLYASLNWQLVYTDGAEVLFARADLVHGGAWDLYSAETTQRVLTQLQTRYAAAQPDLLAAARVQLASLQLAVGAYAQAQSSLDALEGPAALALRARAHLLAGEIEPASTLAERMLRELPEDVRSLDLMAQVWMRRGQPARALPLLQRAVKIDPWDAEASSLLSNLEVAP